MGTAALVARLLLAGVLVSAAVAKFVDLDAFATANRNLGVPDRLVRILRVGVPVVEAVLAVGLLVTPTARVSAVLTVLLFAAFTALLVWNLARGRRPACNCFGSTGDAPISWWTVVRNVVLGLLAVLAATGPSGIPEWIDDTIDPGGRSAFGAVLVGGLVVVAAVTVALVRTRWQLPPRSQTGSTGAAGSPGLAIGTDVAELLDEVRRRGGISDALPTVLVRTDPTCGPCQALLPRLLSWQSAYAGLLDVAVLTGEVGEDPTHYDQVEHLVIDDEGLAGRLGLDVTPSAVLVSAEGFVASPVAAGGIEIGHLVSDAVRDEEHLLPGDPANGVVMANGHGMLSLADLQGAMTLLIFWDPWCGFCQRGLLPLLQWQESIDGTGQRLLVAGQRDEEVTRLQGFQLVGADVDGSVMRLFGGEGTPSAVLIDAAGRVASDIAHGMDEVTALAERSQLLTSLSAPPPT